ncbi:MAG: ABC transporter permease subunit [Chloroflexi bacterium]|nr:ABC transporter permease subunit [Chloroflexota bacterium]
MLLVRVLYQRIPGLLGLLPLLIAWEVAGRLDLLFVLPPFTAVVSAGIELVVGGIFLPNFAGTLRSLLTGGTIAVLSGLTLGYGMARFRRVESMFDIYVDILLSAPVSAIVPVLVVLFGTSPSAIVATVVLSVFFVVTINAYSGFKQVDKELLEMARSYRASEFLTLRRVLLPAALPLLLTGMRLGIGRAFNGAVFGEMLILLVGLGGLIMLYGSQFAFERLDAVIVLVVITGVGSIWLFERLERWLLARYQYQPTEARK